MTAKKRGKPPLIDFDKLELGDGLSLAGSLNFDLENGYSTPDGLDLVGDYSPDSAELDGDPPEGYEGQTRAEAERVLSQVEQARVDAQKRIDSSNDMDYFFCVVFLSMEQRDAFLAATGWDEYGARYVNGLELARKLGVKLPESFYKPPVRTGADKSMLEFALDMDELSL